MKKVSTYWVHRGHCCKNNLMLLSLRWAVVKMFDATLWNVPARLPCTSAWSPAVLRPKSCSLMSPAHQVVMDSGRVQSCLPPSLAKVRPSGFASALSLPSSCSAGPPLSCRARVSHPSSWPHKGCASFSSRLKSDYLSVIMWCASLPCLLVPTVLWQKMAGAMFHGWNKKKKIIKKRPFAL